MTDNTDTKINLYDPGYYFNRELSLIAFQSRVLREAEDDSHPLLERLKFCTILSSNLDEFFMIRVAGLKSQVLAEVVELSYDGLTPREQLIEIRRQLLPIYRRQENVLKNDILPKLKSFGIVLHTYQELNERQKAKLEEYFVNSIMPALTPLSLGPANPFPRLINRSLNIAFVLRDTKSNKVEKKVAFLQIPTFLDRFIKLEEEENNHFVLIEHVIKAFANMLFPGLEIEVAHTFRVTRDADIEIAEDEAEDLLSEIAEQLKQRRWGRAAVRLEASSKMPEYLVNLLMNALDLEPNDVYIVDRSLNLSDFMELHSLDIRELKDIPFQSRSLPEFNKDGVSIFDALKESDSLAHHPYDSFTASTQKYIQSAASDPDVLSIKITLYRTGQNSSIISALKRAAEKGKYVTAFVELKARFDEDKNIIWAKELENVGVHVVYGVHGLKTHAKIALIVRREKDKLKTYLHLATGNYNQSTSRLYTDMGFFTANEDFAEDGTHLFNYLTGYSHYDKWKNFFVAPINLYENIIRLIEREAEHHTEETPGLIIAKINSLAHREVIPALYRASQKGVRIKLIVRGICCLRPGVEGVSETITVRSILGRFLEHSRMFYFKNQGNEEYYLSSADWMSRNLHRRVELMFPIYDKSLQEKIMHVLQCNLADNRKAWELAADGTYTQLRPAPGESTFISQEHFLEEIKFGTKQSGKQ